MEHKKHSADLVASGRMIVHNVQGGEQEEGTGQRKHEIEALANQEATQEKIRYCNSIGRRVGRI